MDEKKLQGILHQLWEQEDKALEQEMDQLTPAALPEGCHDRLKDRLARAREEMEREEAARRRRASHRKLRGLMAAAAVVVLLVGMISVNAFWEELADFFRTWYEDHVTVDLTDGKHSEVEGEDSELRVPVDWKEYWYIEKLPDGCSVVGYQERMMSKVITYEIPELTKIIFRFSTAEILWEFDSEWEQIPNVVVGTYDTAVYQKSDYSSAVICWERDGYFFTLEGNLPIDELIEMAESAVYMKID